MCDFHKMLLYDFHVLSDELNFCTLYRTNQVYVCIKMSVNLIMYRVILCCYHWRMQRHV